MARHKARRILSTLSEIPQHISDSQKNNVGAIRVQKFFAKATILTNLLQSRMSIPLVYPLSSGGMALKVTNDKGSFQWDPELAARSMAQVTPAVIGMAKMTRFLKAGHALSNYQGGIQRSLGAAPIVNPLDNDKRLHRLHPEFWRMQKPGSEWETRHLKKRKR